MACKFPYIEKYLRDINPIEADRLTEIGLEVWRDVKSSKLFIMSKEGQYKFSKLGTKSRKMQDEFIKPINDKYGKIIFHNYKNDLRINLLIANNLNVKAPQINGTEASNMNIITDDSLTVNEEARLIQQKDTLRTNIEYNDNYLFESKKDLNDLVDSKATSMFGVEGDESIDETDKTQRGKEVERVLFNGNTNTTGKQVLSNILESGVLSNNLELLALTKSLFLTTKANVKIIPDSQLKKPDTYMQFNTATNTVEISLDALGEIKSVEQGIYNFLHEIFHERSLRVIRSPKNDVEIALVKSLTEFYNNAKKLIIDEEFSHEMSSLEEFTAGMFSNKDFNRSVRNLLKPTEGFWKKLVYYFKEFFGLKNEEYDSLINDLLQLIDISEDVYEGKDVLESRYTFSRRQPNVKALDKANEKIENIINVLEFQSSRMKEDSNFKTLLKETSNKIADSIKELGEASDEYKLESIKIFKDFMTSQLISINKRLDDPKKFDAKIFNSSNTYIESFIAVQDNIRKGLRDLLKNNKITDEDYNELLTALRFQASKAAEAKTKLIEVAKEYLEVNHSNFSKHFKQVYLEHQRNYRNEARKLNYPKNQIESYVNKKMAENRQLIEDETASDFREMLNNPIMDITKMGAMINGEKDHTNKVIQMLSSILDAVKDKYQDIIQPVLIDLQEAGNEFLKGKRTLSSDEIFKNMVEWSKDDEGFIKGEYKLEFFEKAKELKNAISVAEEEYGSTSIEFKKAITEYNEFKKNNTYIVVDPITNESYRKPKESWKTDLSELSESEKKMLLKIQELAKKSNDSYEVKAKSLKKTIMGADFYMLPGIRKETLSNLKKGNLVEMGKEFFKETFTQQVDSTEIGEIADNKNFYKVYTDASGKEIRHVPIHFRNKIERKYQSIDLLTIYALEYQNAVKFNVKNETTTDLLMFKEIISEGTFIKQKTAGKIISSWFSKNNTPVEYQKENANLLNFIDTQLNNRIYDKTQEYRGKIFGADINKLESFTRGIVSKSSLALNTLGAPANAITARINSWGEVLRDPNLDSKNVLKAKKFMANNFGGLMDDVGRNIYKGIINQVLMSYGGMISKDLLQNSFEHNKALSFAGLKPLFIGQEAGETYNQALHTFTILDAAKIINKDGEYLDKEGNVIDSKDKAASLLDIQVLEDSKLTTTIKTPFYTTMDTMNEYNKGGKTSLRSYITSSLNLSQGNYDSELQAEATREFWGKALIHFKKHIISPGLSRWRGAGTNITNNDENLIINWNQHLQRPDEGNYVTTIRFIYRYILPKLKDKQIEWQIKMAKNQWDTMEEWEKANIKKTIVEIMIINSFATAALLFAGAASDDDKYWFWAALFRRLESESAQYYNPREAYRILKNPLSTLRLIEDTSDVLSAVINLVDPFETDRLEKLTKEAMDIPMKYTPGNKVFKQSKQAYNFMERN